MRWLCEKGGASTINGVRGVDVRSKDGWTPLSAWVFVQLTVVTHFLVVNAASKGHLPVVLYLLTKQAANPLIRNKWGETAFDIAAAVFEVWICEVSEYAVLFLSVPNLVLAFRYCSKLKPSDGTAHLLPITPFSFIRLFLSFCMKISVSTCV